MFVLGQDLSDESDVASHPHDVGHPIGLRREDLEPYLEGFETLHRRDLSRDQGAHRSSTTAPRLRRQKAPVRNRLMTTGARSNGERTSVVDVVVVSYNSREQLRRVRGAARLRAGGPRDRRGQRLAGREPRVVPDLAVTAIQRASNGGFATGVNAGWRAGSSPYVLLLNPDARIDAASLGALARVLDEAAGGRRRRAADLNDDGSLDHSQRRFPRLRSTYARALFLHRVFPAAAWTDELVRDEDAYARRGTPEWVSGACVLVRREALVELDGLDEGFFMYSEDIDLCRRLWSAGYELVFEPAAVVEHVGGASAPRAASFPRSPRAAFGTRGSTTDGSSRSSSASESPSRPQPMRSSAAADVPRGQGTRGRSSPWRAASQLAIRLGPSRRSSRSDDRRGAGRRLAWDEPCAESAESFRCAASRGPSYRRTSSTA